MAFLPSRFFVSSCLRGYSSALLVSRRAAVIVVPTTRSQRPPCPPTFAPPSGAVLMRCVIKMFRVLTILSPLAVAVACSLARAEPLPGTKPLTEEGDIASKMVAGIDKFLLRELEQSIDR